MQWRGPRSWRKVHAVRAESVARDGRILGESCEVQLAPRLSGGGAMKSTMSRFIAQFGRGAEATSLLGVIGRSAGEGNTLDASGILDAHLRTLPRGWLS